MLGFFLRVWHAFRRHSNVILIHFYWLLALESVLRFFISCSIVSRFGETSYFLILSKFNWLVVTWSGCGESRNRLLTLLYLFFFYLVVLCFCVAPSRVFFEYMLANFLDDIINFNRSFNLYIGNFLFHLHSIFIAFILLLIVLLCFSSYSGKQNMPNKPKYNWF